MLIITSPNCKTIFDPPVGGDCSLFLRSNLRYGDDDPLQWPQAYVQNYCHIACVLRGSTARGNPMNILWWMPEHTSFVQDDGILRGIGKLARSFFGELQSLSFVLIEWAELPRFKGKTLVSLLITVLRLLLHHC
jgi:hypothetical protein